MSEFDGKVVLIAGAGKGLGRALAEAFAARGAIIAAQDLTPINLDETVARLQAANGRAQAYVADLASKLALQTMLYEILDEFGRIDVLINCVSADPRDALLEMDEWDWRRTVDINLTGPFLLLQSVAREMRAQGGGVIVQVIQADANSAAGLAAKSGLIGLARAAANQLEALNIRVNAVCSGFPEAELEADLPADPVALVTFLCSHEAANFSGRVLQIK
ncbi:MAG TPA: hypothetical protein DEH22_12095 [Chloroflexi bacterium]|nr:hypothetical protein [Chloroflexota bacterium]